MSLVVSRASPRVRVRVYGPVLLQSFNWQSCEQYFTLLQFKSIILSWSLEHHKHRVCAAPRSNWLGSTWLGPKRLRKRPDPLQRTFFVLEVEPWNIPDSNFPWESLKGSQWKSGSGIFHGVTLSEEPSLLMPSSYGFLVRIGGGSQGRLESGIFHGSTSNTKKVLCRGSDRGIFQIQTSIGNP